MVMQNRNQERTVCYAEEHGGAAIFCYGCRWAGVIKTISFGQSRVVTALLCPTCGAEVKLLTRNT